MNNWNDFKNPNLAKQNPSDDKQGWHIFVGETSPLSHNMANHPIIPKKIVVRPQYTAPERPKFAGNIRDHHDKKLLKKLANGYYPIQADCDLHGLDSDKAFQKCWQFLHDTHHRKLRCIRIISGKGKGILQELVKQWLSLPEFAGIISAFTPANPRFGGEGAQIILLKQI